MSTHSLKKLTLLSLLAVTLFSCTMEKRLHRKGYHVQWNSFIKNTKAKSLANKTYYDEKIELTNDIKNTSYKQVVNESKKLEDTIINHKELSPLKSNKTIDSPKNQINYHTVKRNIDTSISSSIFSQKPRDKTSKIYRGSSYKKMSTIEDDDAPLAFTILLILALTIYLSLSAPIFLGILTPISVTIYLLLSIALTFLNGFFTLIFLLYATSFDLEQHQTSITTQEIIFAIITGGILLGETILISIFFALIAPFGNLSFLVSTLIYVLYLIILGVMGLMSYFFR